MFRVKGLNLIFIGLKPL